jgi:hypothetical protein
MAVLDGAGFLVEPPQGCQTVADTLISIDKLGTWCRAAATRFESGARAAGTSKEIEYARSPAQEYAFEVMCVYQDLTGRKIGYSRPGVGENSGKPTGPLVRFIDTIFSRTRALLEGDSRWTSLVPDLGLNPSAETIASWITRRRTKSPKWITSCIL